MKYRIRAAHPGRFSACVLAAVLLCLLLSGCAGEGSQIALLRSEWDDIMEFFDEQQPVESRGSLLPADDPDVPAVPALTVQTHVEIVESVYNSMTKTASVEWLDDPVFVSASGNEADRSGYEAVPRFADPSAAAVCAILSAHGISSELRYMKNPAPAGEAVALRYAGFSDENGYCMNPAVPVTVYVSAQKPAKSQPDPSAASVVYLTFDDGPTELDTERLLDILDTFGVKASFFTVGNNVEKYPASAGLIADRGHDFGCHTYSHQYEDIYASADALEKEVEAWEKAAEGAGIEFGENKLFRFPGGSVGRYFDEAQEAEMRAMLEKRGYRIFDWNSATNDGVLYLRPEGTSAFEYIRDSFEDTFARSLAETGGAPGEPLIVLMHEVVPETVDLMPWLLNRLIREGYAFGSLGSFPASWTFAERGYLEEDG